VSKLTPRSPPAYKADTRAADLIRGDGKYGKRGAAVLHFIVMSSHLADAETLERTVLQVADLAANAAMVVEEARAAGLVGQGLIMRPALEVRAGLLDLKQDLERELGSWILNCRRCGMRVHWIPGPGPVPGRWAHLEPAQDHEPGPR
jgi:hypothetical protein